MKNPKKYYKTKKQTVWGMVGGYERDQLYERIKEHNASIKKHLNSKNSDFLHELKLIHMKLYMISKLIGNFNCGNQPFHEVMKTHRTEQK